MLSEEELKTIRWLENTSLDPLEYEEDINAIEDVLKLVEKQQKEIEKLEEQKRGLLVETYKNNDEKDKEIEDLKECLRIYANKKDNKKFISNGYGDYLIF